MTQPPFPCPAPAQGSLSESLAEQGQRPRGRPLARRDRRLSTACYMAGVRVICTAATGEALLRHTGGVLRCDWPQITPI